MHRLCRYVVVAMIVAYVLALGLLAIGTFGLFGQERDPLSGAFVLMLGFPWIMVIDRLPAGMQALAGLAFPALNILLIRFLCR